MLVTFLIGLATATLASPNVSAYGSNLSFGSTINLSRNPTTCPATCSGLPRIATAGNHVYAVWLNNTSGNSNLLLTASSNNGSSFGPVIKITNSTTENADQQQIVAIGNNVYIVWQQNVSLSNNNILFRASSNNGTSFGPIVTVIGSGASCGGGCTITTSVSPQIEAVGNNVYVVWLATTNKSVHEIMFKASTTNGSNLSTVTALTLISTAYGPAQPQIAASAIYVYVTWSDVGAVGRAQTYFAASSNSGTSFAYVAAHSLSSTLAGETDLYQEIATAGNSVYVTWTNDTMTTDNTMFASSTNNGATFGAALNLNMASLTDIYPSIAASGSNVYVVWIEASGGNPGTLYRVSSNNGSTFSNTINLSNTQGTSISVCPSPVNCLTIAASGSSVYAAWIESSATSNGVYFVSSSDSGSTFATSVTLSNDSVSNNPVVAGSGSYAYVTWEDDTTGNGDIYFNRGNPFPPPTVVSESASVTENQSQNITLTGNDPAGLLLTFSIAMGPSHGTLGPVTSTGSNSAQVTYTPNPNFTGSDSFNFKATDGSQTSGPATVSVTISAPVSPSGGGGGRGPLEM